MSERFSLKDHLFNRSTVTFLAGQLALVERGFREQDFVERVLAEFPKLELKARIAWISQCLRDDLPGDFREATQIILKALPPPCDPGLKDDDFGDFIYAPFGHFVASYGCTAEHLDFSLQALHQITQRFSAEYAIRPFLNQHRERTLATLQKWTSDEHYHVRRLCSEGTRPRLPWAEAVRLDWLDCKPLLDALAADPTRFVTRSLANHLNDWSKSRPDEVLATLQQWQADSKQTAAELDFMQKHALRSLVKQGHPAALRLLGYCPEIPVTVSDFQVQTAVVQVGGALEFDFCLQAPKQATSVVVDYQIHFQSRRGKLENLKTFKLKNLSLSPGQRVQLSKRHPLKLMTTRTLYSGTHRLVLLVNGKTLAQGEFELVAP